MAEAMPRGSERMSHRHGRGRGEAPTRWFGGLLVGLALLVVSAVVAPAVHSEPTGKVPFDHVKHGEKKALDCTTCHQPKGRDAISVRPGSTDHETCMGKDCHTPDFYGDRYEKTKMCRSCHKQSSTWADMRELWPFPDADVHKRVFYVEFNHKAHMALRDKGREVACESCHHVDAKGLVYVPPAHKDCSRCHDDEHEVPMTRCDGCHIPIVGRDGKAHATKPSLKVDIARVSEKFSHENHRQDRRESTPTSVACGTCHGRAEEAERIGEIALVNGSETMEKVCRSCHNARSKTAAGKVIFGTRGDSCKNCHSKEFMRLYYRGALPASH